ncbi:hypothetical protein BJ508DRAFT_303170 [Ascobolus immersus RN42]|uniref:Uncharacterized protein n=1 Tax=Ascobolus immersus RN42 TaxID=1160509 RepID=A0A3N4ILR2_ASCIM|nr:hypothetical protein BJ508DRAFT_303170 [Ascobolus immersus RN42]
MDDSFDISVSHHDHHHYIDNGESSHDKNQHNGSCLLDLMFMNTIDSPRTPPKKVQRVNEPAKETKPATVASFSSTSIPRHHIRHWMYGLLRITPSSQTITRMGFSNQQWLPQSWEIKAACNSEGGGWRRACALYRAPYVYALNNHRAIRMSLAKDSYESTRASYRIGYPALSEELEFVMVYQPAANWIQRLIDWKYGRVVLTHESWEKLNEDGICKDPRFARGKRSLGLEDWRANE